MSDARVIAMEQGDVYEYRAFFSKSGRARYISHLDLYRTVQRSFKRAGLPVWHTLGFNPHIYLTFPLPISLGYEGVEESFDFRLCEDLPGKEIAERLNAAFPEGIRVTALAAPEKKPEAIASARYTLTLSAKGCGPEKLLAAWQEFLDKPALPAQKRSKKGVKTVDLKPMVLEAAAQTDAESGGLKLTLLLTAGISLNLNPTLLTDTFGEQENLSIDYHLIRRDGIFCSDGSRFR